MLTGARTSCAVSWATPTELKRKRLRYRSRDSLVWSTSASGTHRAGLRLRGAGQSPLRVPRLYPELSSLGFRGRANERQATLPSASMATGNRCVDYRTSRIGAPLLNSSASTLSDDVPTFAIAARNSISLQPKSLHQTRTSWGSFALIGLAQGFGALRRSSVIDSWRGGEAAPSLVR